MRESERLAQVEGQVAKLYDALEVRRHAPEHAGFAALEIALEAAVEWA